ncbi:MAG: ABC transporter substrate-binding protein, partial [Candidatus Methanoplasma sp.]|nr:ABC transporter substrate-binding protein [Candidatus Methanoplasma sp.]
MDKSAIKILVSVLLVMSGAFAAVIMTDESSSARATEGIIIDFGDFDISYTDVDTNEFPDAYSALFHACESEGYELITDGERVESIRGLPSEGGPAVWRLYVTDKGSTEWREVSGKPSEIRILDYSAVAWGLFDTDGSPTPAVDATGLSYYGYPRATRVVSIAPSNTESVVAIGGLNTIVGTDMYSDYPASLVDRQKTGDIAIVGGYSNPSFELVIKQRPDLVICTSTQAYHLVLAEKLRGIGTNVLVAYDGESTDTVLVNMYMIGVGMRYEL